MYEYESKELDREKLEYLRKNTFLGPIAMFKIARAKKQVDDFRKWYQQREGELLEADYTIADELEYELRFIAFQNGLGKQWKQNEDGLSLYEFAEMVMEQNMDRGMRR